MREARIPAVKAPIKAAAAGGAFTRSTSSNRSVFAIAPILAAATASGIGLLNMMENPNTPQKLARNRKIIQPAKGRVGYPRISVTVPSIVIMVPGLYLYRGFYNLGIMSLATSATWFASALLIILALPLGLIFARILTDKTFRYCT